MKTKLILFFIVVLTGTSCFTEAYANPYKVDDKKIDAMFDQSIDLSWSTNQNFVKPQEDSFIKTMNLNSVKADDKQKVAGIVALVMYATGIGLFVPVHRFLLGTNDNNATVFLGYCITASGCGFILLIDGIMLLIEEDTQKYINNPKFIMW